jgi:putative ABC transport system substrate-binding protein
VQRRNFISLLGGAAAWPLVARAQQNAMAVVGLVSAGSADALENFVRAFRQGLSEAGYVEGRNVSVEYHFLENRYDRAPVLMADLVSRRVAVIVAPTDNAVAIAAKAATTMIPIVFGVGQDPVKLGLVASLARPGGNATGINFLNREVESKRLALLHELVPSAVHIAVLLNPANATADETTLRLTEEAARAIGLQLHVLRASTISEIDTVFAAFVRERPDALFVTGGSLFFSRRQQVTQLAVRERIPAAYPNRDYAAAGGLMSYGTSRADTYHHVGIYTGKILKGEKPADLPVVQPTKFELVINVQTARTIGMEVPPLLLARADEVIE